MEKLYCKIEIAEMLFLSINTVNNRIKLLGLVSQKSNFEKTHYFNEYQVELIKDNNEIYYEKKYKIYESKMNK